MYDCFSHEGPTTPFFFSFFFFHFKDEVKESKSRVEFAKTKVVRITIESICTLRDLIREIK